MTNPLIPYSFIPGTKAKANEVNANFITLADNITEISAETATKLNKDFSNISQSGLDFLKENTAPSRNIGEIVASTLPLTDAGLHLLDGTIIYKTGIYSDFVEYIASIYDSSASYFCTEAEWQQSVNTYGVCGKFVYDSVNNTVRLPKYSNKIYTKNITSTAPVIGNGIALGLTNGIDYVGARTQANSGYFAFMRNAYGEPVSTTSTTTPAAGGTFGITTDPTKSGLIAKLSDITTSLEGYYYIVIATSTKTDIQVDIDEVATDLNGKADTDLSNVPNSKGILTESYVNGTSWYRVYSDGWCEQGGYSSDTTDYALLSISLLKVYKDTNYTLTITSCSTNGTNSAGIPMVMAGYTQKFTSYFTRRSSTNPYRAGVSWQACGYIR